MKAKIFVGKQDSGKSRVARMICEHFGEEKTVYITARDIRGEMAIIYPFDGMFEYAELLVIDDCQPNFDYSFFFNVEDNRQNGGDLQFKIPIVHRKNERKEILIKQIILITEKLSPKWKELAPSFDSIFDIVEFPLSGNSKTFI